MVQSLDLAAAATKRTRLPSLTGMRFIAAAAVLFGHAGLQWAPDRGPVGLLFMSPTAENHYNSVFHQGEFIGVGFFFVLSGFVLSWSARSRDTAPTFWRRRIFKIFPNHAFSFLVLLLMLVFVSDVTVNGGHAALNLFLLQGWFPRPDIIFSVNIVAWTLSCEALFYLFFPLVMRAVKKIRPERLWACAGGVVALIFIVPLIAMALPDRQWAPGIQVNDQMWFIYFFPPVRMLEFLFGILLARIVATGRRVPLGLGGSVALGVSAYALSWMVPTRYNYVALMIIPLGLVIASGALGDIRNQSSPLSSRPMVWLGNVSFALYLWHYPVLLYVQHWLGRARGYENAAAVGMLALIFGISLVTSYLVFTLVERPIYRRFATSPRRARTPGDSAPPPAVEPLGPEPVAPLPVTPEPVVPGTGRS